MAVWWQIDLSGVLWMDGGGGQLQGVGRSNITTYRRLTIGISSLCLTDTSVFSPTFTPSKPGALSSLFKKANMKLFFIQNQRPTSYVLYMAAMYVIEIYQS